MVVQDTGKGIEPDYLSHVFEPFSQEDGSATRAHEGIGLGLSIVRSLVELHGGRIRVASAGAGQGATFTVELPVFETAPMIEGGTPAASLPAADGTGLPAMSGVRVLVIDDQEYTRDLVTAIFRRADAEVQSASSVREGLERFEQTPPHVVVCDLAMPGEDGFAFVRAVRALPASSKATPVVALTAFSRPEDRDRALASGFDAYLSKPVDPEELATTVLRLSVGNA
jgi:CheY-like chemotaxis protein